MVTHCEDATADWRGALPSTMVEEEAEERERGMDVVEEAMPS